jgi:D-hydroxyproline dehydrogenase subunit beta
VSSDVLVVGGGIVGAACAYFLALEGFRPIVFEQGGGVGTGVTASGMGHVVVMDDSEAQFALTRLSRDLWDDLLPQMPEAVEHDGCGTLWIAARDDEWEAVQHKCSFYRARGVDAEIVDGSTLQSLEPTLRPGLRGALRVPGDSVIYPTTASGWFLDRVRERGGEIRCGERVNAIEGRSVVLLDGTRIEGELVVNAAGPRTAELSPGLPIEPKKGHLIITDRVPRTVHHQLVELGYLHSAHESRGESVAFNVQPRKTGQLLIGSSRQYVGWQEGIDRRLVGRMLARALEFVPSLADVSAIRIWTGFRPATPDNLPLVGPYEPQDGVLIAAGHEGLGITTSVGTGRLIASIAAGRALPIDLDPFLPGRVVGGAHG